MKESKSFKSDRKYRIWMYSVSHSTLILRSEKQYFDVEYDYKYIDPTITIDVIFTGVDFISIPDRFEQLEINNVDGTFIFNSYDNWYIKAANCAVGKYGGDNEDAIWDMSLKYDEIIEL